MGGDLSTLMLRFGTFAFIYLNQPTKKLITALKITVYVVKL